MTAQVRCDDCGLDLSLSEFQLEAVRRRGNPVPRPACPARPNGAHRVSSEQLKKLAAETREMHRLYPFTKTVSAAARKATLTDPGPERSGDG